MSVSDPLEDRTATTEQLETLSQHAASLRLDRYLSLDALGSLDPEGRHVVRVVTPNHQGPRGELVTTHHRCQVYVKMTGLNVPASAWLDVALVDWDALPTLADTVEVYKARQRGAERRSRGRR